MKPVMPWIDLLSGVDATDFQARRDAITDLVAQARQPSAMAAHLLAEAYVQSCLLETAAKNHWSVREIEQAQRSALEGVAHNTNWLM